MRYDEERTEQGRRMDRVTHKTQSLSIAKSTWFHRDLTRVNYLFASIRVEGWKTPDLRWFPRTLVALFQKMRTLFKVIFLNYFLKTSCCLYLDLA